MKRSIAVVSLLVILLVLVSFSLAGAQERAPGTPTLRWVTTSPTTAELRADNLSNGSIAGNGAMTWDIYFRFPASVATPLPGVSIVAGPAFTAQSPCGFTTNVSQGQPSEPGGSGTRGVLINGFCASGIANNPVTGSDVLVATVTLSGCSGQSFVMDLDTGAAVFGSGVTQFADRTGDAYVLTAQDLTDGTAMCVPAAVTMSGFDATSDSAAPFVASAWPLLAGAAAVAAGGAYALLRRKS